jgi:subtilase family serine protease
VTPHVATAARATATADAISAGLEWLESRQGPGGELSRSLNVAATALAVMALAELGLEAAADREALAAEALLPAHELALGLLGLPEPGLAAELEALRLADGSYGDVATTALCVLALGRSGRADPAARAWLSAQAGADGSFGTTRVVETTALAALALASSGALGPDEAAVRWLRERWSAYGGLGGAAATALGLLALRAGDEDPVLAAEVGLYLLGQLQADGGWGGRAGDESSVAVTALCLWALAGPGRDPEQLAPGIAFLETRRDPQGGYYRNGVALRDTATVASVLADIGREGNLRSRAAAWLVPQAPAEGWLAALRTGALHSVGAGLAAPVDSLGVYAGSDGGHGPAAGHWSQPHETAQVLEALSRARAFDAVGTSRALAFLDEVQNEDSSHGSYRGDPGRVLVAAQALEATKRYRASFPLEARITALQQWLESRRHPDGGLGDGHSSVLETAAAFSALMDTRFDPAVVQGAHAYLLAWQRPDGSWDGSAYSTALALRALHHSKPNLRIRDADIGFSSAVTVEGEIVTVTATVHNDGGFGAEAVAVRFYEGDPAAGGRLIGADRTLASIPAGESASASAEWNTTGLGGDHVVHVLVDPEGTIDERDETDNRAFAHFHVSTLPDLAIRPGDLSFTPEAPSVSEPITFRLRVHNLGETRAQDFDVLLHDGDPDGGGALLGSALAFADGGVTLELTFQAMLSAGAHTIVASVDRAGTVVESNELNNTTSIVIDMDARVDLTVATVNFSSQMPPEGSIIQVYADLYNAGLDPVQDAVVRFYLGDPQAGGVQLGADQVVPQLEPGRLQTVGIHWNTTGHAGNNRIWIVADPDGLLAETNELNNVAMGQVLVTSYPDLAISASNVALQPAVVAQGDPVRISAYVENRGHTSAENVQVQFFLDDPAIGAGQQLGDERRIPVVPYRSGASVSAMLATSAFAPGTYRIYVLADGEDSVVELDETNNAAFAVLTVAERPDLLITDADLTFSSQHPEEGEIVEIRARVSNPSALGVGGFHVDFYEGSPEDGGVLIDSVAVSSLPAGGSTTLTASWDSDRKLGLNLFHVLVDSRQDVGERNETNNRARGTLTVEPATRPDLVVRPEGISFDPAVVATGETVRISAVVWNERRFDTSAVRVRFVRIDAAGAEQPIGQDQTIDELPGKTQASVWVELDTGSIAGLVVITVIADPLNAIEEASETNNRASGYLPLRLPESARVTGLRAAVSGTTVSLSWESSTHPGTAGYHVLRDGEIVSSAVEEAARGRTPTASSSASGHAPARALDANGFTSWRPGPGQSGWWSVRFGTARYVQSLAIVWEAERIARAYDVQIWNGEAWVTALAVTGNETQQAVHRLPALVKSEGARLLIHETNGDAAPGISEIRINALKLVR